jgi:ABC-type transporter Mla subunit MlaD
MSNPELEGVRAIEQFLKMQEGLQTIKPLLRDLGSAKQMQAEAERRTALLREEHDRLRVEAGELRESIIKTEDALRTLSARKTAMENIEAQLAAVTARYEQRKAELETVTSDLTTAREQLSETRAQFAALKRQFAAAADA